jgi:hypothetical protein
LLDYIYSPKYFKIFLFLWRHTIVQTVDYFKEPTILTFGFCVFYFLTLKRVLDILVLAGIQHLVDFSRLLQVSKLMPYQKPNMVTLEF